MILKNIFFNPLKEIIIWIEFFINLFPGQIGKIIRLIWFSLRTVRFLVIRIDTNCKFIKINNIIFGKGVGISRNCSFYADGGKIIIGDKTAFNENCHINASNGGVIKIGKKCPIGPNVVMRTSFHNFNNKEMYIQDQGHTSADIIIEDPTIELTKKIVIKFFFESSLSFREIKYVIRNKGKILII